MQPLQDDSTPQKAPLQLQSTQQTASDDDQSQGEDIDATPEQLQKLRQVMDQDTTSAIVEGLAQADP